METSSRLNNSFETFDDQPTTCSQGKHMYEWKWNGARRIPYKWLNGNLCMYK